MEIADKPDVSIPAKQSILIQLKNTIRKMWEDKMVEEEKQQVMMNLLLAFIRCSYNFQLIKLYREIVTGIVRYEYQRWLPVEILTNKINNNEDIVPVLHFIIAIATNF